MTADYKMIRQGVNSFGDYKKLEDEFQMKKQAAEQAAMLGQLEGQKLQREIETGVSSSDPATIRIANEIQSALKSGDVERANLLHQVHKTMDKGIMPYGQPFQYPTGPQTPVGDDFSGIPPATMADMQAPPSGSYAPPRPSMMPMAMPGYGAAVGSIAADKKGMETQAQKNVELDMNPQIEAATKQAGSRALYTEEGFQSLPRVGRVLESRELKEEFLDSKIDSIKNRANAFTTGFGGALTSAMPGTPAHDLKKDVETLLANAGFDTLQEMRDNSPTGGALGQVSNIELGLLQAAAEQLSLSQTKDQFINNLNNFQMQRQRSLQNIRRAYQEDSSRFGAPDYSAFAPDQTTNPAISTPYDQIQPDIRMENEFQNKKKPRLKYNPTTGEFE